MKRDILAISGISALIASLCCLPSIILVLFGLSGISFAAAFGNALFFGYWWAFVSVGVVLMTTGLYIYVRRKNYVCSLADLKKKRRKLINLFLSAFIAFIIIGN